MSSWYVIIVSVLMAAIFFILAIFEALFVNKYFFKLNSGSNKRNLLIKKIAIIGLMIALNAVLSIFKIPIVPNIDYVTISALPLLIVGFMYGPFYGYITGILGNLFYSLIGLTAAFNPGFVLSAGIDGLIPGLLIIFFLLVQDIQIIKKNIKLLNLGFFLVLEFLFIIMIFLKKDAIIKMEYKWFFTTNIWCVWLFFGIGNILFLELISIIYVLIRHKILPNMHYSVLQLLIFEEVIRLFVISLLLDPLWLWETYDIDFTWIKIIKFPLELFVNLFFAAISVQAIVKFEHNNFLIYQNH